MRAGRSLEVLPAAVDANEAAAAGREARQHGRVATQIDGAVAAVARRRRPRRGRTRGPASCRSIPARRRERRRAARRSPDRRSAPVATRTIGSSALPKAAGPVIVASPSMTRSRWPASIAAPSAAGAVGRAIDPARGRLRRPRGASHAEGAREEAVAGQRAQRGVVAGERCAERSARRRADAKRRGADAAAGVNRERAARGVDVVNAERGGADVDVAAGPSARRPARRAAPAASPTRLRAGPSLRRPHRCSPRRSRRQRCACSRSPARERRRVVSTRRARRRMPAPWRCRRTRAGPAGRLPGSCRSSRRRRARRRPATAPACRRPSRCAARDRPTATSIRTRRSRNETAAASALGRQSAPIRRRIVDARERPLEAGFGGLEGARRAQLVGRALFLDDDVAVRDGDREDHREAEHDGDEERGDAALA